MTHCPSKDCKNKHCPYFHGKEDKRKPMERWFKLFPRCRTVNFPTTFYSKALQLQQKFEQKLSCVKHTSFSTMGQ